MRRVIVADGGDCDKFHFPLIPSGRAFTSCRCPVTPGGGTGPTVSVLSIVGRVPPRGAGSAATDNFEMHRPSGARLIFCATSERNTKHQTPSSRESPESKHQKPSSKHQGNPKFQAPNRVPRFELGASLEFRAWCLGLAASLELGVWNLELVAWALSFSKIEMRPSLRPSLLKFGRFAPKLVVMLRLTIIGLTGGWRGASKRDLVPRSE